VVTPVTAEQEVMTLDHQELQTLCYKNPIISSSPITYFMLCYSIYFIFIPAKVKPFAKAALREVCSLISGYKGCFKGLVSKE